MNTSFLVSTILNGVLGTRRKRSYGASRYLTGGLGSLLTNPTTLMTAASMAWGVYETLQHSGGATAPGAAAPAAPPATPPATPPSSSQPGASPAATSSAAASPPSFESGPSSPVPPLPTETPAPAVSLNDSTRRLLRLAISAATADGAMNARERAAIVQQATAAGVPESALADLTQPVPLAEIVAGVDSAQDAATLYVLAFTILRADEQVTTVERIYLAQLANLLHLDEPGVQALERNVGERIDALGDQGQPGG
jgi:uncharacterized membrane protein YebE (DUF533 family)